jgi:hypothetical protein
MSVNNIINLAPVHLRTGSGIPVVPDVDIPVDITPNNDLSVEMRDVRRHYKPLFLENLENKVRETEDAEKSAKRKIVILKAAFVAFLILGIVCAGSFFLLPAIGAIAAAVGLSVAVTMVAWETLFLTGGLLVGFSFIPRKFINNYIEKRDLYHEKAEELGRCIAERRRFESFLWNELVLVGYTKPEEIVADPLFAELYYTLQNIIERNNDLQFFVSELEHVNQENLSPELELRLAEVNKKLDEMRNEIQDFELQASDYRDELRLKDVETQG